MSVKIPCRRDSHVSRSPLFSALEVKNNTDMRAGKRLPGRCGPARTSKSETKTGGLEMRLNSKRMIVALAAVPYSVADLPLLFRRLRVSHLTTGQGRVPHSCTRSICKRY